MSPSTSAVPASAGTRPGQHEPIVEIDDFHVSFPSHYGEVAVIDSVSLTIGRGETLGLVGESGSGKTLLSLAILGLLPDTARVGGRIHVAGVDVLRARRAELRAIRGRVVSPVFQDALTSLNPNRTIGQQFGDVWRPVQGAQKDLRAASCEALEMVALENPDRVLASYPHQLSGGMRQRALIALALLNGPELLIADEPTTALDRAVEVDVLTTLRRLQRELGLSILLVTHDMEVVRAMASRVAVLYGGQLCEVSDTDSLFVGSLHPYTRGLIGAVESLHRGDVPLRTIPGVVPHPSTFGSGCRFLSRCPVAETACEGARPQVTVGTSSAWCFRAGQAEEDHPRSASGDTDDA